LAGGGGGARNEPRPYRDQWSIPSAVRCALVSATKKTRGAGSSSLMHSLANGRREAECGKPRGAVRPPAHLPRPDRDRCTRSADWSAIRPAWLWQWLTPADSNAEMEKIAWLWGGSERLRANRGIAASVFAAVVIVAAAGGSSNPTGSAFALVIVSPLLWWLGWWLAGVLRGVWIALLEGKPPEVSVGRAWQSSSGRKQLRQDGNGRVVADRGGILLRRRFWFVGSGTPPIRLASQEYDRKAYFQASDPVPVGTHRDRHFWWYGDEFFWTNNDDYDGQDIKALLFSRERQKQRELEHARALLSAAHSPAVRKREPISRDVKLAVFQRDEGKCIECGSDFDIQYDHIIPFSMGGANTPENLQLLCARCNQQKGGRL
jgi:hypothetical protein